MNFRHLVVGLGVTIVVLLPAVALLPSTTVFDIEKSQATSQVEPHLATFDIHERSCHDTRLRGYKNLPKSRYRRVVANVSYITDSPASDLSATFTTESEGVYQLHITEQIGNADAPDCQGRIVYHTVFVIPTMPTFQVQIYHNGELAGTISETPGGGSGSGNVVGMSTDQNTSTES